MLKKPLYEQVRDQLREMIQTLPAREMDGYLYEGDLQIRFNVSRNTLRHAVSLLCEEGLLARIHGGGIRVIRQSQAGHSGILIVQYSNLQRKQDESFWWELINGIAESADRADMFMEIRFFDDDEELAKRIEAASRRYHLRAVVGMGSVPRNAVGNYPLISVFPNALDDKTIGIAPDYSAGYKALVGRLKEEGCNRFLWLGGPSGDLAARDRTKAFLCALHEHGLPEPELSPENSSSWYKLDLPCMDWLDRAAQIKPDALLVVNDHLAAEAYNFFNRRGISIPTEMRIIGFDNQNVSLPAGKRISTISFRRETMGDEIIMASLWPERYYGKILTIPTELILRDT